MFCREYKIIKIAPSISAKPERVLNAKGLSLFPGFIDPHVHFRDPGFPEKEDLRSGSMAAAAGGVTSFLKCQIPTCYDQRCCDG